jgi:sarcosine dehydrogenase
LNSRGGIECDLTVVRLGEIDFYIVTGTGFRTHDFHWINDHIERSMDARLVDVTEDFGTLSLMGPNARTILKEISDIWDQPFAFGETKTVTIARYLVRALRVTYVGELGWELHVPREGMATVFDMLVEAGTRHGLVMAGYRAMESLRLEKSYRAWSAERQSQPLRKMLATFTAEREDIVLAGRETILRNAEFAGYLTSGGYGYTIGRPIGMGYVRNAGGVDADYITNGNYQLVVAGEIIKANVHLEPLYDPQNLRVKA